MEQYIKKSALVAEIERRIKINKECMLGLRNLDYYKGKLDAFNDSLSFLDTLEVKEAVDAEIVEVEDNDNSMCAHTHLEICTDEDLSKICKAGDKAKVIIIKQK